MLAVLSLVLTTVLAAISITVHAAPEISHHLIVRALQEADAIWRECGIRLVWEIADDRPERDVRRKPDARYAFGLDVTIDSDRGPHSSGYLPIGWIVFHGGQPEPQIHLSYANALDGLERAVGHAMAVMPRSRGEELISLALGRTLAHELGHYLLASEDHADAGVMQADWTPDDLFGAERKRLRLDAAERRAIAARLELASPAAKR